MQANNNSGQGNNFEARKQQTMRFVRERVIDVDEKDRQFWLLITDVPLMPTPWQYVCFILNVIIPGSGTMIASCFCERWSKTLFSIGVFQLFLAYILIGWVFSIYWGVLIVRRTWSNKSELDDFLDKTKPRSDQMSGGYREGGEQQYR